MKRGECSLFTETERQFIYDNYQKLGGTRCALQINKSAKKIHDYAYRNGLQVSLDEPNPNLRRPKKFDNFKVDHLIFSQNFTPESVYILGMIWADGYVSLKNKHSIVISSTKPDSDNLIEIVQKTGDWGIYSYKDTKHSQWKEKVTITTSNRWLVEFLIENDYHIKKSASADKILFKIPQTLQHYWFLGLSDGDGYFRKHKKYEAYQWSITSRIDQDWNYLIKLCDYLKIAQYKVSISESDNGNCSRFVLCSKATVTAIADFLYQDYQVNKIGLPRKFEIIKNLIKSHSQIPE